MNVFPVSFARSCALVAIVLLSLAGCESMPSLGKRIDYKSSSSSAPSLELPPNLSTPQYDDRYQIPTRTSFAAARSAGSS